MFNDFTSAKPRYLVMRWRDGESRRFAEIPCANCSKMDTILRLKYFTDGYLYALATYSSIVPRQELLWRIAPDATVEAVSLPGISASQVSKKTDFLFFNPSNASSVPVPTISLPGYATPSFAAVLPPPPTEAPLSAPNPNPTQPKLGGPTPAPTPPSGTSSPPNDAEIVTGSGLSGGAVAAIVTVFLLALVAAAIALFLFWRRREQRRRAKAELERRSTIRGRGTMSGDEQVIGEVASQHYAPLAMAEAKRHSTESSSARRRADSVSSQIKRWGIDHADLEFGDKIGSGNFGVVFEGEWRGAPVAIKQTHSADVNVGEFKAEAALMSALRPHRSVQAIYRFAGRSDLSCRRNVTQIYGLCEHDGDIFLVMELLFGGSLEQLLEESKLEDSEKVELVLGIASGMHHIHSEKILHRDRTQELSVGNCCLL